MNEKKMGVVLYVDGGCRQGYPHDVDSRYGGWGIHGYSYKIGESPKNKKTKKDTPSVSGYALGEKIPQEDQVNPVEYIDAYGSISDKDTSDKAEMTGFKQALSIIQKKGYDKVHLRMDNQYVIQAATGGYEKWMNEQWKRPDGSERPNKDFWMEIMELYQPIREHSDFSIEWVNGHSGELGNERADYLATKGVYKGRNGTLEHISITYSSPTRYRDPKPTINRLLSKNRWYFDTSHTEPTKSKDGRYIYHCGSHGPDNTLIGKPMSDSVAYVVYTKEIQHVLEAVRQKHMTLVSNPLNLLCMCRLDTLLLPRIYDEIEQDGTDVLSLAPRSLRFKGLCTIEQQELTRIIEPSGLTFKLIDVHNFMVNELDKYLEGKSLTTDITDHIYSVEKQKKKEVMKMHLTSETKKLIIEANVDPDNHLVTYHFPLTIGIDIPSRETMKAIEDKKPKVLLNVWRISDAAFRYAVIFDCGDDVMMWTGKDSSYQLIFQPLKKK